MPPSFMTNFIGRYCKFSELPLTNKSLKGHPVVGCFNIHMNNKNNGIKTEVPNNIIELTNFKDSTVDTNKINIIISSIEQQLRFSV